MKTESYDYRLLGLTAQTSRPINELVAAATSLAPDFVLKFAARWEAGGKCRYESPHKNRAGKPWLRVWEVEHENAPAFQFVYDDGCHFLIAPEAGQIWVSWPNHWFLADALPYLLGPVFGFALRLRGVACLHASAVVMGVSAVALVGSSGAGKSTTAAAFAKLGFPILSDDIVTLDEHGGEFAVHPGYPQLRLWQHSAAGLFADTPLPAIAPSDPDWDKRYLDLSQPVYKFEENPRPLRAVYVLQPRDPNASHPRFEPLSAREAFIALSRNMYSTYLLDQKMRAHEFGVLSRLIASLPVTAVTPAADLNLLPDLCRAIEHDALERIQ